MHLRPKMEGLQAWIMESIKFYLFKFDYMQFAAQYEIDWQIVGHSPILTLYNLIKLLYVSYSLFDCRVFRVMQKSKMNYSFLNNLFKKYSTEMKNLIINRLLGAHDFVKENHKLISTLMPISFLCYFWRYLLYKKNIWTKP